MGVLIAILKMKLKSLPSNVIFVWVTKGVLKFNFTNVAFYCQFEENGRSFRDSNSELRVQDRHASRVS